MAVVGVDIIGGALLAGDSSVDLGRMGSDLGIGEQLAVLHLLSVVQVSVEHSAVVQRLGRRLGQLAVDVVSGGHGVLSHLGNAFLDDVPVGGTWG